LTTALLAAHDLVEQIERYLKTDDADAITLKEVVKAWQHRSDEDGRPKPKALVLKPERNDDD
jgi:hypothetical protein